jgi:hypothetical protein
MLRPLPQTARGQKAKIFRSRQGRSDQLVQLSVQPVQSSGKPLAESIGAVLAEQGIGILTGGRGPPPAPARR